MKTMKMKKPKSGSSKLKIKTPKMAKSSMKPTAKFEAGRKKLFGLK